MGDSPGVGMLLGQICIGQYIRLIADLGTGPAHFGSSFARFVEAFRGQSERFLGGLSK
jgi:hypothetical protein